MGILGTADPNPRLYGEYGSLVYDEFCVRSFGGKIPSRRLVLEKGRDVLRLLLPVFRNGSSIVRVRTFPALR